MQPRAGRVTARVILPRLTWADALAQTSASKPRARDTPALFFNEIRKHISDNALMHTRPHGAPTLRKPTLVDITTSLHQGLRDFIATPFTAVFFASFYVFAGLAMGWITYATGQTFWLVLAIMGFPLVGALAAVGFYEISRRRQTNQSVSFASVVRTTWAFKNEQLPWLAAIIVVLFLFWFFLGHMIFALFLGLSPMTNISSSLDVFLTSQGLTMIAFGSAVGSVFAVLVFSLSVLGMPMLIDRDVDFMTAMLSSISAVAQAPVLYLAWGAFIGLITFASMLPSFLGLFISMPVLGHATWHLYKRVST